MLSTLRNRCAPRTARAAGPAPAARRARPRLEALDPRDVPATFFVTSGADSGPGTLRAAIEQNNTGPNMNTPNEIVIDSNLTISLTSGLSAYNSAELVIRSSVPGDEVHIAPPMMQPWLHHQYRFLLLGQGNSGTYKLYDLDVTNFGTNTNGGAILHQGGRLEIHDCDFSGNRAAGNGGAIANVGLDFVVADNSYFGPQPAGPMTQSATGNQASGSGGAIWHFPNGGTAPLLVENSEVGRRRSGWIGGTGNVAGADGGGIWSRTVGDTEIYDTYLAGNVAGGNGGAVYQELGNLILYGTPVVINYEWISDNRAGLDGGGVYCNDSTNITIDCAVWRNFGQGLDAEGNWVPVADDDVTFDGYWGFWVDRPRIGFFDYNHDQINDTVSSG